jgi:hypothetical protein
MGFCASLARCGGFCAANVAQQTEVFTRRE